MKASIFFVIRARSGPRFCSRQIPLKNVTIKPAIQETRLQNSSGEAGRGRWCPSVECGIEHIFVFFGSRVLSRRLCSLVESLVLFRTRRRDEC
jgi:hypothetical protein